MGVYSFLDVQAAISGPGLNFTISEGGVDEGGITVAMRDPKNNLAVGADGTPMHSLHAGRAGTITIRCQKTSPLNALFSDGYSYQTSSSRYHGRNTITMSNPVSGDSITAEFCAFQRLPDNVNAMDAGTMEWVFDCGIIHEKIGNGEPVI